MSKPGTARNLVRWIGLIVALGSLIGLAVLPTIRESYRSRAVLTQRVQVDKAGASLFGDGATPIGSPQLMIIEDPKAVVPLATGAIGPRQVNDAYLAAHNIYPLQLKTVDYTIGLAQMAFIGGVLVGSLLAVLSRRKASKGKLIENVSH